MSLSTSDAVSEVHRIALQQALSRRLGTQPEWDRFTQIAQEAAERTDAETDAFRRDYQARLAEARQVILNEQNQRSLALTPPGGAPAQPMSRERLDLLAMNRVQQDHDRRIAAIRVDEVDAYQALRAEVQAREERGAHARDRWQGALREGFNRTNQISPHEAQTRGRAAPNRSQS